ncbi:MAG: CDP-glycerol glycerophosphotransferase family protein [Bacillota bacterium]|nr:CDP-glycerol glycerophosphotransferase family protein [Bacillota bacterium]
MDSTGCGILIRKVTAGRDAIIVRGICALKLGLKGRRSEMSRLSIRIHGTEATPVRARFFMPKGIPFAGGYRLHPFCMEIRCEDALLLDVQNRLMLWYGDQEICGISYSLLARRKGVYRTSRLIRSGGKVMYFRQTAGNKMWFVVRSENRYDSRAEGLRVFYAWLLSRVMGRSDHILMFEKESSRYEESASVLFEKLVDQGYRNVYYLIDRDNPAVKDLNETYRAQMIEKDSFRHLLYFFRCHRFVGTETMEHAAQLRTSNRRLMAKARSTDLTHVFLQHGVMYMVSLDADARAGFIDRQVDQYRTVVSSEAEAMHFILLGGLKREELYITGLAKFDRSVRDEDADWIMIMPTWRRWETNLAERDFRSTGYYRMLENMVNAVPDEWKDRIIVKPHPLMEQMMERSETQLSRYLRPDMSHDEVLRRCRLLITDYSSIAYDAFYRGANAVFWWGEMSECMKHYGGAHLMLNEYNAFGDICYTQGQMEQAVRAGYSMEQNPDYVRKYRRIVEFHDNRNTERIIGKLKEDHIL